MKFKLLFFCWFFPVALSAQTELMQKQIREDYSIFKNILTSAHPGLYEYTSQAQWDSLFTHFEEGLNQLKNADDLFKSMSALADHVKDGHFIIHHQKMDTVPSMFPLFIKIIDEKFYADTDDFDIPVGSEITSVDGINSEELLNRMLKYAPSDGYNVTRKYRQIELEFGILLFYEFGAKKAYTVRCRTPDNLTKTTEIQSQSLESIGNRNHNRHSYFSAYHQTTDKAAHFRNTIHRKWPFVYFIDSTNTAVLTVNSFGVDPQEFKSRLIDIFKEIKKKKTDHLIIDVRQNIGGFRINAINLFSFISEQVFKQRTSESIITTSLPEQEHIIHTMSDYGQFLETYFDGAEKKDDHYVLRTDKAEEMMKPYKKVFKGKIYILTSGKTFSAASAFALSAKNNHSITLVGEETGGGYYFHTGQFPVLYELPNSKIMLRISLIKINHYVRDESVPKGKGVIPDIEIKLTPQDLIEGKDSQLDYVINEIPKEF
ncbi:hypothetical protein JKA74_10725 [Marivirga sp. S37H4]|uniref:Tail specific protease domain-containing protein n=1 Tax=Marivirga aurantiaca TaxID=2802615 RepID=A0A935C9C9_9BACT|nr:S41 family peptidase [Marivirga aurantiaca]MBK6265512.1 hypothetical protein [Marivirga aurantiaca]